MKNYLVILLDKIRGRDAGVIGACLVFVVTLFCYIFGVGRTLMLFILTFVGYYIGTRYFSDEEQLKALLDKLFPPGKHY